MVFVSQVRIGGDQLEESHGPAEYLPDGLTGELSLVCVVSPSLPCPPAGRKRGEPRLGQ